MNHSFVIAIVLVAAMIETPGAQGTAAPKPAPAPKPAASQGPILVVETVKGIIEIQTFPADAPKTVEQIVALAKRNFYNGLRVHRVEPGYVVQFGDPLTRDMTKRDRWGTGGSGRIIGVSEVKRKHVLGSVAMAHRGDPKLADSQMYITFGPQPQLDRNFVVFGQVTSGMDVARKLAVNDIIRRVTVKP
jgi:peptidyl-prolyl cis-trans isomerase B (cyclophilin B)